MPSKFWTLELRLRNPTWMVEFRSFPTARQRSPSIGTTNGCWTCEVIELNTSKWSIWRTWKFLYSHFFQTTNWTAVESGSLFLGHILVQFKLESEDWFLLHAGATATIPFKGRACILADHHWVFFDVPVRSPKTGITTIQWLQCCWLSGKYQRYTKFPFH